MEATERKLVLDHLAASRERLVGAVAGLSEEQRVFRPAEDRWSVVDVEHLTVVENNILNRMLKVLEGPADPGKQAELRGKDQIVAAVGGGLRGMRGFRGRWRLGGSKQHFHLISRIYPWPSP